MGESQSLPLPLANTDLTWLGAKYTGKVRDVYSRGNQKILIATDRLSAFDRVLTTVPLKGQVLTKLANFWFQKIDGVVPHHVVATPDPNVVIAEALDIIPIEVVVRGYLVGSAWRDYQAGRSVSGVSFPPGLKEFDKLPEITITPSTKEAQGGHDTPISEVELVSRGIVAKEVWQQVRDYALTLFALGTDEVAQRGLILVDTKYEFGMRNGKVVLADEIHTLDSSRFWKANSPQSLHSGNDRPDSSQLSSTIPEMLDKEPVRRWLLAQGFLGEGEPPAISDRERREWMNHYLASYALITGESVPWNTEDPGERIERNLRHYFGT